MPLNYVNATGIGTGGINTDFPSWAIGGQQARNMQDVVVYENVARQRRGFANYLPVTPASSLVGGVGTYSIAPLGNVAVTVVDRAKTLYTQSTMTNSAWLPIIYTGDLTPQPQYVPRAQYQDEILLCDQTGNYPMLRTMGRASDALVGLGIDVIAHQAQITVLSGLSVSGTGIVAGSTQPNPLLVEPGGGSYIHPVITGDSPSFRVVNRNGGSYTVRNIDFAATTSAVGLSGSILMYGTTWPNVEVYSDGLASWANGSTSVNIEGGGLTGGPWGKVFARTGADALVPLSDSIRAVVEWDSGGLPTKWQSRLVSSSTDTALSVVNAFPNLPSGKKAPYSIMRRSPFREVEVHQECLWGTGVEQHPSRVYYSPRGWDMQTPPELAQPWNGITDFYSPTEGMMRYTDIEGAGDGDKVMALLSSDGPLLIITQRSCYGAYGSWPSFQRQMVAAGAGCIDTRSAVGASSYGQFWCGRDGVYGYRRGKVTDLTSDRIGEHWRRLMDKFDAATGSYVVGGIVSGHYIISCYLTRGGANERVTLLLNIARGAWSYLSNMDIEAMQNPSMWSREEILVAARNGEAQLVDIAPALNMTGDAHDSDGTSPQLIIESGDALQSRNDPDSESRLVELRVSGIVDDTGAASPSSSLSVTTRSRGAVTQGESQVTMTGVLEATGGASDDELRRERLRIGNSGRLHNYTITAETTDAENVAIGVAEVGMNVRPRRNPR